MIRMLAGVVGGYVVMFVVVFATFTGAYALLGADGAFRPGSYEVTPAWIALSFVLGLVAAIAGGMVCVAIARRPAGPRVLAGMVLLLGLAMAIPVLLEKERPSQARTEGVGNSEAMMRARTPAWVALLTPLVGAVGVLAGAGMRSRP